MEYMCLISNTLDNTDKYIGVYFTHSTYNREVGRMSAQELHIPQNPFPAHKGLFPTTYGAINFGLLFASLKCEWHHFSHNSPNPAVIEAT